MKIVVFDDDPTGSQTVDSCPLLLSWDVDVIRKALRHPSPLLFLLSNTRALSPEAAAQRNREICHALKAAIKAEGISFEDIVLVSRGDSTLRGHGVIEPMVLEEEFGPFDATMHVPAFFEGGRTTVNGTHLLNSQPVHKTPFAQDYLFGYSTSNLSEWLEEKSRGAIKQGNVLRISLSQLDQAATSASGMDALLSWLLCLKQNQHVVVDAERYEQLEILGKAVQKLIGKKRFLFRSAASMINGLLGIKSKILKLDNLTFNNQTFKDMPGMVMVGSYVPLANKQLDLLLQSFACEGVELNVDKMASCLNSKTSLALLVDFEKYLALKIEEILSKGNTPVVYTSRWEKIFSLKSERLIFSEKLAQFTARLARRLTPRLSYLISKGGITTQTLLTHGYGLNSVYLEGQILPGLSLVSASLPNGFRDFPIITFPGNLGDSDTLLEAWQLIDTCRSC